MTEVPAPPAVRVGSRVRFFDGPGGICATPGDAGGYVEAQVIGRPEWSLAMAAWYVPVAAPRRDRSRRSVLVAAPNILSIDGRAVDRRDGGL